MSFTCSSRYSRASQSPHKVEKQPKSTPDMYNPPRPLTGVDVLLHTHMDIHCGCYDFMLNFAKIRSSRKQRFNKRLLLCYRFITLSVPAVVFMLLAHFVGRHFQARSFVEWLFDLTCANVPVAAYLR